MGKGVKGKGGGGSPGSSKAEPPAESVIAAPPSNAAMNETVDHFNATSEKGSAVVLGAAASSEDAVSNMIPQLTELLASGEHDLDFAMGVIGYMSWDYDEGKDARQHHATLAKFGEGPEEGAGGAKKMALVANDYKPEEDLGNLAEAQGLHGALAGHGYEDNDGSGVLYEKSGDGIRSAFQGLVGGASEGDQLVGYFGGHGAAGALLGTDDNEVSSGEIAGYVGTATSKGAHIRFILEACESGATVDAVRDEIRNDLLGSTDDAGMPGLVAEASEAARTEVEEKVAQFEKEREELKVPFKERLDAADARKKEAQPYLVGNPFAAAINLMLDGQRKAIFDEAKAALEVFDAERTKRAQAFWDGWAASMKSASKIVGVDGFPERVVDSENMGAQLDWIDEVENAALEQIEPDILIED